MPFLHICFQIKTAIFTYLFPNQNCKFIQRVVGWLEVGGGGVGVRGSSKHFHGETGFTSKRLLINIQQFKQ